MPRQTVTVTVFSSPALEGPGLPPVSLVLDNEVCFVEDDHYVSALRYFRVRSAGVVELVVITRSLSNETLYERA